MLRRTLLTVVVPVFGLVAGEVSTAQNAPGAAPGSAATAGISQSGGLEEVVVTAEKRESTVQRTAATINVVSSDMLVQQQIVQLKDLNQVLPDTNVVPATNFMQVTIRGLGSDFVDPRADPDVAISVNGLYYDRPLPNGFGFLDVARVENLNGPQGTLYGRNAAAGAMNIVTNQPSMDKFSGMAQITEGSLDEDAVTAVLNIPLSDTLAIRAAYGRERRDGYIEDYYDDISDDVGRVSALWKPTDKLSVYLEANYLQTGGHGNVSTAYPCDGVPPYTLYVPVVCDAHGHGGTMPKIGQTGTFLASDQVHVDYDFGAATLTSISGFVGTHTRYFNLPNQVTFNATNISDNYDYSEELRLTGHDTASHRGGLAWQTGIYLFSSTGNYFYEKIGPNTVFPKIPQSSEAGFAQATYGVTDAFRLTGGARFTHDYKGLTTASGGTDSFISVSGNNWSFKGGAEYDLAPENMLYATVSTGYIAGGPNGGALNSPPVADLAPTTFQPEKITAYEAGSKNRFWDNRLQVNADFYYYDISNYQLTDAADLNEHGAPGPLGLVIENIGKLTTDGAELSTEFALTPQDRFTGTLTWAQGHYSAIDLVTVLPLTPGIEVIPEGAPIVNVSPWSGLLGYNHTWNLAAGSSVVFSVNSKIAAKYHLVIGSTAPDDSQPGYTMTDASLGYHGMDDRWSIRAWVKNLENSVVNIYGQNIGTYTYATLPPRTYGATLTVNF